ncbi:CAP domain-containing protein [Enterovirga rhinocerotis]|uniref:Uncharacterized protein YkwD n=1 Tax=Enterovirga rhinocerotis TaxID=1339210 RepID=A0A4R7BV70_9HYPH|nr:CAP domain-containing protein [Enterovirga rhinocerotis]TDR89303.1 uncharacterized protein YkwD [Enterovirga rhinocerotis]
MSGFTIVFRSLRRLVLLAAPTLGLALLAGCAGDLAKLVPGDRVTTSVAGAEEAARLVSEYRRERGLPAVVVDRTLNEAAEEQARAVAEAGKLSHGDFAGRMARYAVGARAAENLSAGPDSVSSVVMRWRKSPSHDRNLLMPGARRIGLARADSPGHGYRQYWAMVVAE